MPESSPSKDPLAAPKTASPAIFSLTIAVGILLLWIGYGIDHRPVKNQFAPAAAARFTESAIDPNTASWASLVRIPGIGPARAQKLLAWRKAHQSSTVHIVFHSPADLRHVPSFGPKTVAQITAYLRFPPHREVSAPPP